IWGKNSGAWIVVLITLITVPAQVQRQRLRWPACRRLRCQASTWSVWAGACGVVKAAMPLACPLPLKTVSGYSRVLPQGHQEAILAQASEPVIAGNRV